MELRALALFLTHILHPKPNHPSSVSIPIPPGRHHLLFAHRILTHSPLDQPSLCLVASFILSLGDQGSPLPFLAAQPIATGG